MSDAPQGDAPRADAPRAVDPLPIRRLDYLGPMATTTGWRPESVLPEIAFSGRSNVGKSSLINRLVRRKQMARVSNTPGRTREIHFFRVNDDFVLVDLPGYGYARISKERQAEWRPLMEGFLRTSPRIRGVVQLLDVRHDPTRDDLLMLDFLAEIEVPTIVVATKVDKLSAGAVGKRMKELARLSGIEEEQMIAFSATTGRGRDELAEAIMSLVRMEDEAPVADEAPAGDPTPEDGA